MRLTGPVNAGAALLLGCVAGLGSAAVAHQVQQERTTAYEAARSMPLPPPSARLQAAIDEIRRDGVHVAPDARRLVDARAEAAIEEAAAATDNPVYTIVWTHSNEAGDGYEAVKDKLERAFAGERALVHVWEGPARGETVVVGAVIMNFGRDAQVGFVGDPAVVLPRGVLAAEQADWREPFPDVEYDYWGGTGGAVAAGLLFAAVAIATLLLALALVGLRVRGRFGLPGRWSW